MEDTLPIDWQFATSFLLQFRLMQLFSKNNVLALTKRKISSVYYSVEFQEDEHMAQVKVAQQTASTNVKSAQLLQAGLAALLGIGLFMGVAFSNPATVHNAAHDSRHGVSVHCH